MAAERGSRDPEDFEEPERPGRVGSLEVDQDLAWERQEWRVERLGWVAIVVFMSLALAGLFGTGPLSHARTERQDVRVEYERFARRSSPIALEIEVPVPDEELETVRIDWVPRTAVVVESVLPEPESSAGFASGSEYAFIAGEGARRIRVKVVYSVEGSGFVDVNVLAAGQALSFTQFVYP